MNLYSSFQIDSAPDSGWRDAGKVFLREPLQGREFTYQDLDEWSARLAHRLRRDFGIEKGDRVAVQVEKSPMAFFLYLACLRAGAVFLPLNTAYQESEVEYFLRDAEPGLFVCDPARKSEASRLCMPAGVKLATLDGEGTGELSEGLEDHPASFATVEVADLDPAAILYTSGTTGRSKGAVLSHSNLRSNGQALVEAWGFRSTDTLLHSLPIYHVHGLFISLHCSLMSGSQVLWFPRFDAKACREFLPQATVFMGVPTYYTRLLELEGFGLKDVKGVRLFISGSAPLRPETFGEFESRTGHRILERYGMTETGINSTNPLAGSRLPGTVGKPLVGTEIRLTGETGMIEVRGPNVFQGYWRQPEKTAAEFTADGFFRTGDLGEWDENGYLRIVGRGKDLVITGGFNVYPKEVELVLDGFAGVAESAVFGVPHPDFGEGVVAAVVRNADAAGEILTEEGLIATIRGQLASFKVPKRIFFLEQLPRNAMGKVQKSHLRERFAGTFA